MIFSLKELKKGELEEFLHVLACGSKLTVTGIHVYKDRPSEVDFDLEDYANLKCVYKFVTLRVEK